MKDDEKTKMVINALKQDGKFDPKENSFNEILSDLKNRGYVVLVENELKDKPPIMVFATDLFKSAVKKGEI
jgi:hypothetical protein